jgi:serine/threonine-protein kinase
MNQPLYSPGTIIAGKYKIERAIARGGCSIVYRGLHQDMGRQVALKLMAAEDGTDVGAWAERFRREARLASQLRHRNTITTFDYGAEGDLLYIAMEWVDGDSLRNVIKKEGAMEAMRVARLSAQMLRSLNEAHGLGILHRDLKPSNIMLTTDADGVESLKVLDFGLAKAQFDPQTQTQLLKLTQDGDFVGTPRYASPEQLKGRELTTASDIYGVGMVMWEMLTGKPAVPDIDFGTCVQYHLGSQPWELPPEIDCPVGLAHIVECALAKKAADRFQTCEAMLEVLDQWIANPNPADPAPSRSPSSPSSPAASHVPGTLPPMHELFGEMSALSDPSLPGARDSLFSTLDKPRPVNATPEQPPPAIRRDEPVEPLPEILQGTSFSQLDGPQIEVARRPEPRQVQPPAPQLAPAPALATARSAAVAARPVDQRPAPRVDESARNKRLALGALILLGAALTIGVLLSGPKTPATDPLDPNAAAPLKADPPAVKPSRETPSAEILLTAIKRAGWNTVGKPDSTELGDIRQTTARVLREGQLVDVTFYECDEEPVAMQLMGDTELPARAVRIGRTVTRLSPVEGKSAGAVTTLQNYMYKVRDVYENGASGATPDPEPPAP